MGGSGGRDGCWGGLLLDPVSSQGLEQVIQTGLWGSTSRGCLGWEMVQGLETPALAVDLIHLLALPWWRSATCNSSSSDLMGLRHKTRTQAGHLCT